MDGPSLPSCPFCKIAATYPPYPPTTPPPPAPPAADDAPPPTAHLVLSTPHVLAFLDILPLSPAHLLLCPRAHRDKLTDVPAHEAAEMGRYLAVLSRAVVRVLGEGTDWNVVQNNGVGAGQVVGHVHFHVIPRRSASASASSGVTGGSGGPVGSDGSTEGRFAKSYAMFGKGMREELDDEEGAEMAAMLREAVAEVLRQESKL